MTADGKNEKENVFGTSIKKEERKKKVHSSKKLVFISYSLHFSERKLRAENHGKLK